MESPVVYVAEETGDVDVGDGAVLDAAAEVDDDPPEGEAFDGEEVTYADGKARAQEPSSCAAAPRLSRYVSTG